MDGSGKKICKMLFGKVRSFLSKYLAVNIFAILSLRDGASWRWSSAAPADDGQNFVFLRIRLKRGSPEKTQTSGKMKPPCPVCVCVCSLLCLVSFVFLPFSIPPFSLLWLYCESLFVLLWKQRTNELFRWKKYADIYSWKRWKRISNSRFK